MNTPTTAGKENPDAAALLRKLRDCDIGDAFKREIDSVLESLRASAADTSTAPVHAQAVTDSAVKLLRDIRWKSADKDNMEYTTTITYSQMDAIEAIRALAAPPVELPGKTQALDEYTAKIMEGASEHERGIVADLTAIMEDPQAWGVPYSQRDRKDFWTKAIAMGARGMILRYREAMLAASLPGATAAADTAKASEAVAPWNPLEKSPYAQEPRT